MSNPKEMALHKMIFLSFAFSSNSQILNVNLIE